MLSTEEDWTPGPEERELNLERYGEDNPWSCVDEQPVYIVEMQTPHGREVKLTYLKVYQHTHTDETREWVCPNGEYQFIFDDEWPEDNVLNRGLLQYHPYGN